MYDKFCRNAQIAQSVEQRTENPRVTGSIPVLGIEKIIITVCVMIIFFKQSERYGRRTMYYIGICDDDPVFIRYIKRLFSEVQQETEFFEYLSGEELISDMEQRTVYDLLILDVLMPGMNGNETAKAFRKQFPNTLLVFCSGVCMPTAESFEVTPYRYWLKEYTEERMQQEVEEVLCKMKRSKVLPYIMGRKKNQFVKLPPEQIYYISIAKRGTVLYCGNEEKTYTSMRKLADFYEQLGEFGFAYAHNSYIVNLKHVAVVGPKELEFVNGEKLTISRSRGKEFKKAFAQSLSQKYER